ncbi:hypothetical protein [Formosa sp. PL04]|uniref:hypothetical protein n=1 Tax=Formosa sp. PL04 TaxID=3081755 RepID=UPI0029810047|nr:hypothetical protein [Formosa sp. PL04]MDW5287776.1 hypothetical protein [Formosa sp. PL04]
MKKLLYIGVVMLSALSITSCGTDEDTVAPVKAEAGFLVDTSKSTGKLLGSPESGVPLDEASITFTDAELTMNAFLSRGNVENLEKIEFVKTLILYRPYLDEDGEEQIETITGEEILVATSTDFSTEDPFIVQLNGIDELLEGTGVTPDELRIGDVLKVKTKITEKTGEVYYFNSSMGTYDVTINCSSNLAGTYLVYYSGVGYPYVVTELSPGLYEMNQMFAWPTSGYVVKFTDTCGELTLLNDWPFSNTVSGTGYVDTSNGNLVWTSVTVEDVYDGNAYTMVKQ